MAMTAKDPTATATTDVSPRRADAVALELAQLEALEHQLTRMKMGHSECGDDSDTALSATTTATASSPSSGDGSCFGGSDVGPPPPPPPPRTPVKARRSLPSPVSASTSGSAPSRTSTSAIPAPSRIAPARSFRRAQSTSDLSGRVRTHSNHGLGGSSVGVAESVGKIKKVSSVETRRAYALAIKTRMSSNANVSEVLHQPTATSVVRRPLTRKRSGGASNSTGPAEAPSAGRQSSIPRIEFPPPSMLSTPRRRRDSVASTSSSISSISSSPSTTSTKSSNRLQRVKSTSAVPTASLQAAIRASSRPSGIPTPKVSVMQRLSLASIDPSKDQAIGPGLVEELKAQYLLADQAAQQLLRPSTSGASTPTRQDEVRRLRSGIKSLSEHSDALMLACEVFQRQQADQHDELDQVRRRNTELQRELELSEAKTSTLIESSMETEKTEEDEDATTPVHVELGRRLSNDSSLSTFVDEMLRKATEKIEEKWKTRFADQLAEHERALAIERERVTASVMSSSRLVTETKHEREDELKAVREENVRLTLENKQLGIDVGALQKDLEFMKVQLADQDEIRNSASFWEKTTDLAKNNRALTEELTQTQQDVKKLDEALKDLKAQNFQLRSENSECVRRTQDLEIETQVLQDKLTTVEGKFEDEKTRREQFQVNVEQLTVENTALYAQMVALQTTHAAKMEELRAGFERRNVILAGEMRALQAQNQLMRQTDSSAGGGTHREQLPSQSAERFDKELNARLQEVTDELLCVRQELVARTDQIAELEKRMAEGEILRRKLHNTVQELRGNIRVHVRLRPFLRSDGGEGQRANPIPAIQCDTFGSTITTTSEKAHTFAFDKVYAQSDTQEAVFQDVSDFIQSALDGYNVCIFAYGQTGSGKTHTMQGSGKAQMRGIIPRALQLIINSCRDLALQGWAYTLDVTFYEIYNESIRDLLTTYSGGDGERKYNIRTDRRGKNYVEGLTTVAIDFDYAEEQLEEIVHMAACNRSVDKTDMNAHSSRSHSIFGLTIRGINDAQQTEVDGSLSLVDLAGSERLSRSNATGDRLKEAQAINKSLSALADVFQALAKKAAHVPYRNSKLTYALQPALSGDGKTLMMVNLSPTLASLDESVCSLRFAQNVSQCELGAPTRQIKARAASVSSSSGLLAFSSSPAPTTTTAAPPRSSPGRMSTPTSSRPRSLTTLATPPIAKRLFL